jgi:hypothetical protein
MTDIIDIKDTGKHEVAPNTVRDTILLLEKRIMATEGALVGDSKEYLAVCPLQHTFVDNGYVREIFLPKGMFFVTKIHKKAHPYFIMRGVVSVITENGAEQISAPFHAITQPGTKRVIYTHEDTIWITVHSTQKTNLAEIEEELIAKDFAEIEQLNYEVTQ